MKYLLVVGVGRSGTSLLQSMLASHPDLTFPPETGFIRRLIVTGRLAAALNSGGPEAARKILDYDTGFKRTFLASEDICPRQTENALISPAKIYKSLLDKYSEKANTNISGDKDPRLIEWIPAIVSVLPECHIIHVIRDPRDLLASKKKADWSKGKGTLRHLFAGRVQFKLGCDNGPRLLNNHYHEVIYEELLKQPTKTLEKLCDSMGVSFSKEMLNFRNAAQNLVTIEEHSWKKETLGPLLPDNSGKWKDDLTQFEVALTELICCDVFRHCGYEITDTVKLLQLPARLSVYSLWIASVIIDPIYRIYRNWKAYRSRRYA